MVVMVVGALAVEMAEFSVAMVIEVATEVAKVE